MSVFIDYFYKMFINNTFYYFFLNLILSCYIHFMNDRLSLPYSHIMWPLFILFPIIIVTKLSILFIYL